MSTVTLTYEELNEAVDRRVEAIFRERSDRRMNIAWYVFGAMNWSLVIAVWVALIVHLTH
jgi:hypothetical protein